MAAEGRIIKGSNGGKLGENIYVSDDTSLNDSEVVKQAIKEWYSESNLYDYEKPSPSPSTEHFTQLISLNTKELGFGFARTEKYLSCVCVYYPNGNSDGNIPPKVYYR